MHTHVIKSTTGQLAKDLDEWDPTPEELISLTYQGGPRDWVIVIRHYEHQHQPDIREGVHARYHKQSEAPGGITIAEQVGNCPKCGKSLTAPDAKCVVQGIVPDGPFTGYCAMLGRRWMLGEEEVPEGSFPGEFFADDDPRLDEETERLIKVLRIADKRSIKRAVTAVLEDANPFEIQEMSDGRFLIQDDLQQWLMEFSADGYPISLHMVRGPDGDVRDNPILFGEKHIFVTTGPRGEPEMRGEDSIVRCGYPGCAKEPLDAVHRDERGKLMVAPVQPDLGVWVEIDGAIEFQTNHRSLGRAAVSTLGNDKAAGMIATHLVNILNLANGEWGLHPQSRMIDTNNNQLLTWINAVAHTLASALRDPHDAEAIAQAVSPLWNPPKPIATTS